MTNHLVYSIDFDGCTDLPTARSTLVKHIAQHARSMPPLKSLTCMIGSSRQTLELDLLNGEKMRLVALAQASAAVRYWMSSCHVYNKHSTIPQ